GSFDEDNFVVSEVLSEDNEANLRVVKFEVQDINEILNAKAHIIVTGVPGVGEYDMTHNIRLKFDGEETSEEPTEQEQEEPSEEEPQSEHIADGEYTINYEVLHETEDKASSMARYIATPASLTVKDGKNTVFFT